MTFNILDTPTKTKIAGMVLLWSRCDYNHDLQSHKEIIIEPEIDKQFFSGRNLENIIAKLEKDNEALSCYVSRALDKIIIYKKKKGDQ